MKHVSCGSESKTWMNGLGAIGSVCWIATKFVGWVWKTAIRPRDCSQELPMSTSCESPNNQTSQTLGAIKMGSRSNLFWTPCIKWNLQSFSVIPWNQKKHHTSRTLGVQTKSLQKKISQWTMLHLHRSHTDPNVQLICTSTTEQCLEYYWSMFWKTIACKTVPFK